MSASEFAFLALGLVLGVAAGAALVEVLRSRPPAPREIRLTVEPNSIPRRPATLAASAFTPAPAEPAHGGPADRRELDRGPESGREADRGRDPNGPRRAAGAVDPAPVLHPSAVAAPPGTLGAGERMVGIAIHPEPDPALAALRRLAAATAERAMAARAADGVLVPIAAAAANGNGQRAGASPPLALADGLASDSDVEAAAGPGAGPAPAATADQNGAGDPGGSGGPGGVGATGGAAAAGAASAAGDAPADGPCVEQRRVAEERCAHALRAREQAETARDALRAAQRSYDDHLSRIDRAQADADPRAVRALKEAAQHAFREARASARSREDLEAAARDWLTEINRINQAARTAAAVLERERSEAAALVMEIERLTVEADAARIAAEAADEACLRAREAVAECEEAGNRPPAPAGQPSGEPAAAVAGGTAVAWPGGAVHAPDVQPPDEGGRALVLAPGAPEPAILGLLRGDRRVLHRLVTALATDDPADRERWQRALSELAEAIVARSIEAAALDFPTDHPFWAPFTRQQNRDIVAALAALGYRFDGLGGWLDDRIPGQRDLSLAVGYAGLDPMRIRHWPSETEMAELFRDVSVAADEYLAEAAGGLTLGELVSLLGLRADGLTDLWNDWGRVRPLLLSTE